MGFGGVRILSTGYSFENHAGLKVCVRVFLKEGRWCGADCRVFGWRRLDGREMLLVTSAREGSGIETKV